MAEQARNTDHGKLAKEQRHLNCQINFFIIRRIWNLLHRRGGESLYHTLNIKKVRYTRQVDSGSIRLTDSELKELVARTGLSEGIFKGDYRFVIAGETEADWQELFSLRKQRQEKKQDYLSLKMRNNPKYEGRDKRAVINKADVDNAKTEYDRMEDAYKKAETKMFQFIDGADRNDILGNRDFWCLCVFARTGQRPPANIALDRTENAIKIISQTTFREWNLYPTSKLNAMKDELDKTCKMLLTLLNYREYSNPKEN